jgi:hypothetical protein
MAHYAFIDENSIVVEVITGRDETDLIEGVESWEQHYEQFRSGLKCVRTSYNGNIRKNYAGIGYIYDPIRDAFYTPSPFKGWVLNEDTCQWEPPIAYPADGKKYYWNEELLNWELLPDTVE